MLAFVTFAVPAPNRGRGSALLGALLWLAPWNAVFAASPEAGDPDAHAQDLGAVDDGPDQAEDDEGETETDPPDDVDEDAGEDADEPDTDDGDPDDAEVITPPRFDGPYVGLLAVGTLNFASVIDLDTPAPFGGGGGFVQAGDAVFPWMSIGIAVGGQYGASSNQRIWEGALLVEFGFAPMKRYPLSIRAGFGFGGGAVTEAGVTQRFGFGGALFKGSLRYEFFPLAARLRPDRGGGWAIGPELGWLGATPAGKGQPFVNTVILGLSTSFYFGS